MAVAWGVDPATAGVWVFPKAAAVGVGVAPPTDAASEGVAAGASHALSSAEASTIVRHRRRTTPGAMYCEFMMEVG